MVRVVRGGQGGQKVRCSEGQVIRGPGGQVVRVVKVFMMARVVQVVQTDPVVPMVQVIRLVRVVRQTWKKSAPNHPGKPLHPPPLRTMSIWKQHISKRDFPNSEEASKVICHIHMIIIMTMMSMVKT